jgi:hypothetical protein
MGAATQWRILHLHVIGVICGKARTSGLDPLTQSLVPLFNPRSDQWEEHFTFKGVRIEGRTPVGRATAQVLAMNDARRLELRAEILAARSSNPDR